MDITLMGMPFNGDGTPLALENPAQALRDAGLPALLADRGHRVRDLGDLPVPRCDGQRDPVTGVLNQRAWHALTAATSFTLYRWLRSPDFLLVLGGDCAIVPGICLAMRRTRRVLAVAYVDGHADARLPEDSPTGEPADLVLTALTGRIRLFDDLTNGQPILTDEDIVVLGYRDADRIREFGIRAHTAADLRRTDVRAAVVQALAPLADRTPLAWLHFDVDVLDPSIQPAVLFPEWGGLDIDEATVVLAASIATTGARGMSVACYHPRLDPGGRAAECIVRIVADAVSHQVDRRP